MSTTLSVIAIVISVVSASIASVAAWTNREKLRLDLYERRFRVYERAVDLHRVLTAWNHNSEVPAELGAAMEAFRTSSVEGHFLFSAASGVPKTLDIMNADAYYIVNWGVFVALSGNKNGERFQLQHDEYDMRTLRFMRAPEQLREQMAPFLNFHSFSALPSFLEEWP